MTKRLRLNEAGAYFTRNRRGTVAHLIPAGHIMGIIKRAGYFAAISVLIDAFAPSAIAAPTVVVQNPEDIATALGVQQPISIQLKAASGIPADTYTYTVPANQRLIIEYASGSCTAHTHTTLARVEIKVLDLAMPVAEVFFTVNFQPISTSSPPSSGSFGHLVRIYAGPKAKISVVPGDLSGSVIGYQCTLQLSGQLVHIP